MSLSLGQILYTLLTRPPLMCLRRDLIVRLACMKHAASVRPEPGSNSPLSESLCPSLIGLTDKLLDVVLTLAFAVYFVLNHILLESTSIFKSFSAILFSMFNLLVSRQRLKTKC